MDEKSDLQYSSLNLLITSITSGEPHHLSTFCHTLLMWIAADSGDLWNIPTFSKSLKIELTESRKGEILISQKITVGILKYISLSN